MQEPHIWKLPWAPRILLAGLLGDTGIHYLYILCTIPMTTTDSLAAHAAVVELTQITFV